MAVTGVTNAHGPSPKPTVCRPPTCSLTTATGSNHATRSLRWMEGQSSVNKSHFDFFHEFGVLKVHEHNLVGHQSSVFVFTQKSKYCPSPGRLFHETETSELAPAQKITNEMKD